MTLEIAASEPCVLLPQQDWMFRLSSTSGSTEISDKLKAKGRGTILSTEKEMRPYIDIDMGKTHKVSKINLISPTEPRLKSYSVYVSAEKFPERNNEAEASDNKPDNVVKLPYNFSTADSIAFFPPLEGRYFRIRLNGDEPQSLVLSGLDFYDDCGPSPIGILRDPEESKCDNGGFETGTFDGWFAQAGRWKDGAVIMERSGVELSLHSLLRVPFQDEFNLPIGNPCKGNYVVRLGNSQARNGAERLSYRFTVNQNNADFFFRFAFVQNDAGHIGSGTSNPYFWYKIKKVSNGDIVNDRLVQFNPLNPDKFFIKDDATGNLYRSWTCVNINLSDYIGQEMIAEFENSDCNQSGHFGYSYIDGLCTSARDNLPKTTLTGRKRICNEDDYVFSGTSSCNANRSVWTVLKIDPHKSYILSECTKEILRSPGSINIKTLFNECSAFDATKRYRITLKVISDCGEGELETLDTEVVPRPFDYPDILVCKNVIGDINVRGINTCGNCTSYQWSPSFAFVDPTARMPTLNPLYSKCDRKFQVTATTEESGCIFKDDVKLTVFEAKIVSVDKDVDKTDLNNGSTVHKSVYCGYEIKVNVKFGTCPEPNRMKVLIKTEADPYYLSVAEFESFNSQGLAVYKTIIPQSLGKDLHNTSNKLVASILIDDYISDQINSGTYGVCESSLSFTLENRFWYYGYWRDNMVAPGNFIPHGTITPTIPFRGVNDRPAIFPALYINNALGQVARNTVVGIVNSTVTYIQPNPIRYGYGAFEMTADVVAKWGADPITIKQHRQTAMEPTITEHNRFRENEWKPIWDGSYQGNQVQQGVYLIQVSVSNCQVSNADTYHGYIEHD
jgi:hypothetical protein